jgi:hypothetical protein
MTLRRLLVADAVPAFTSAVALLLIPGRGRSRDQVE